MNSRLAIITFVDAGATPDHGLPPAPGRPDHALPPGVDHTLPGSQPYPDHGLPPVPGGPVQLPVYPYDPTHPIAPGGERPTHPIHLLPGARFVLIWLACKGLVLVPDHTLPGALPTPGHDLPANPAKPDNTLPPAKPGTPPAVPK